MRGLRVNNTKTSVMTVGGKGHVKINEEDIEDVEKVKFLGSMMTKEGDSITDIKKRLAMAKTNAIKLSRVWQSSDISLSLKKN